MATAHAQEIPTGPRDTNAFYAEGDPLRWVDHSLVDAIKQDCGRSLLDLGCGVGGYSKVLQDAGYTVKAMDINPAYVGIARGLGVDATVFDGTVIPLPDGAVDTVFMIEVLEHLRHPQQLLAEVFRVARKNVVVTVPNNTQGFGALLTWSHMLDVDHKQFFTVESLGALLRSQFREVKVQQIVPVDRALVGDLLPRFLLRAYRVAARFGFVKDRFFFRLLAVASK